MPLPPRRRFRPLLGLLAVLLCLGLPALWTWREVRQTQLDLALMRAAHHRDAGAVATLLRRGADPNAQVNYDDGRAYCLPDRMSDWEKQGVAPTPLMVGAWGGDVPVMEALLRGGADVNARAANGWTALHGAVWSGRSEVAEFLVRRGADVNARTRRGETPLQEAAGRAALVALLRHSGAKQ